MLKFIHTADWHLGAPNQHPILAEQMLPKLIGLARSEKVDFILCVGDLFDTPRPEQSVKDGLLSTLLSAPDVKFIFTVGNHDYTTKAKTYHSLVTYQLLVDKLPNVRVCPVGNNKLQDLCTLVVLPDSIENLQPDPIDGLRNVLAWHGMLPGFDVGGGTEDEAIKAVMGLLKAYHGKYLALGDIHKHVQINNRCWYPGPPVQKTFSDTCGVVIVELAENNDIKTTSMSLGLPKKITLDISFEEGKDSEQSLVEFVKEEVNPGQFLKLKFHLSVKVWSGLNKKTVQDGLKDYTLSVKLENDPIDEQRDRQGLREMAKAKTVEEEISTVLEMESYGLDKEKLKKTCYKYL